MHFNGNNLVASAGEATIEIDAVFPDKFHVVQIIRGSRIELVLDGDHGWILNPQGLSQMNPTQYSRIKDALAIYLPVKIPNLTVQRKVTGIEKIGGKDCYVVQSQTGKKMEQLYFDVETGLLMKIRNEIETSLGTSVNETTFEDYRDVNGVKMPHSIDNHFMGNQSYGRISAIQGNVDVDPSKFNEPKPQEQKSTKPGPGN
jgi:hypothetical protein